MPAETQCPKDWIIGAPDYRELPLTLPEIAELERKDAAELFDYLLANPLRSVIHGGRERYLIVIDALDEAGSFGVPPSGGSGLGVPASAGPVPEPPKGGTPNNPLVEMLARNAQRLPEWLGLVVCLREKLCIAENAIESKNQRSLLP